MPPQDIIRRKRDGLRLEASEIDQFVAGITDGSIGEGQMAAFAMAVLLNKLDLAERVSLTRAMAGSGIRVDWSRENLPGPILDKHSTGGVGDKVSLILAPIIAACGGFVPMLAGRALGHTGGTLDKLSAIPGYRTQPDLETLRGAVRDAGCAIIGATAELAPADRRLYAVRDVTATVESLDLITASILSKKLAAGLDALVMDVKFGSGAFLPQPEDAKAFAESIVAVAGACGLNTTALLTDMNEVLGRSAGNALEMAEAVAILKTGAGDPRLIGVTIALAGELLALGGLAKSADVGQDMAGRALTDGRAAEHFGRMVTALGGPTDFMEKADKHLHRALVTLPVYPHDSGRVASIDVRAIGRAVAALGGGRIRTEGEIDTTVGFSEIAGIGEAVEPSGRPLAVVHAKDYFTAERAAADLKAAVRLSPPTAATAVRGPLVAERVAA